MAAGGLIYLDTHVVVWLYASGGERLSSTARERIEAVDRLLISPMVSLELTYLYEIDRIAVSAARIVAYLAARVGLRMSDRPFAEVASVASRQSWTRDPFDRIIVAQAALDEAQLLTKDRTIHEHYHGAVW